MNRRRIIEAAAVLFLLPATLGLQWLDADGVQRRQWEPAKREFTVPAGQSREMAHIRWRLLSFTPEPSAGQAVMVRAELEATPLDAFGLKQIKAFRYALKDGKGRVYTAIGLDKETAAGKPTTVKVEGAVHKDALSSVRLALLWERPRRLDVLYFAR